MKPLILNYFQHRCVKNGVECTYTVVPSPKDVEYMQELEYIKQIDFIQQQMSCMEKELSMLKLTREREALKQQTSPIKDYPSPESIDKPRTPIDKSPTEYHSSLPSPSSQSFSPDYIQDNGLKDSLNYKSHSLPACHKKAKKKHYCQTLFKVDQLEAKISKQPTNSCKPWVLTVKNGNLSIDTHISSHSELMSSVSSMLSTAAYQQKTSNLPFPLNIIPLESPDDSMSVVMTILIWRKYSKSRFKSMTKYTPTLLHCAAPQYASTIISIEDLNVITLRLIFTYFQCLHLQHFTTYIPTFVELFMNHEESITQSPVVMALCSVICQQACHHISSILPKDALPDYGLYYFEQARELIAEQFDQVNLETFCTYIYMAVYKLKTKDDDGCKKYLSMVNRLYGLLLPQYRSLTFGESFLFHRVYNCASHCQSVLEIHSIMENLHAARGMPPLQLFKLLDEHDRAPVTIAPDDSEREVKFINVRRYIHELRDAIKQAAQGAAASDLPTYIAIFGHHIEMAMRHWYRSVLPKEYQLSLPLFDDHIDDLVFFTTLETECTDSPLALITTLSLYNEYLIMAKAYVPKSPEETQVDTDALIRNFKEMQNNTDKASIKSKSSHWLNICMKLKSFKQHHQHHQHHRFHEHQLLMGEDEPDEEYFTRFIRALNPSKLNFDMPIIHTSIKAALNVVRIVQFFLSRDYACFLDLRWIMNAWEVLLRAARCKYQQPEDDSVTLDRIRANLILCLGIVKEQIEFSRRDPSGAFVRGLEQEFEKVFV
jgi:hypothetical protein